MAILRHLTYSCCGPEYIARAIRDIKAAQTIDDLARVEWVVGQALLVGDQ